MRSIGSSAPLPERLSERGGSPSLRFASVRGAFERSHDSDIEDTGNCSRRLQWRKRSIPGKGGKGASFQWDQYWRRSPGRTRGIEAFPPGSPSRRRFPASKGRSCTGDYRGGILPLPPPKCYKALPPSFQRVLKFKMGKLLEYISPNRRRCGKH